MPQLTPYHLTFPHGLHVGRGVESLEDSLVYAPSDTLLAALFDTWHYLGRDVADLLAGETAEPALRVTSAFPFVGQVRFYPMPIDLSAAFSEKALASEGAGKRIKKIRYISEGLLQKASSGHKLDDLLFPKNENETPTNGLALQGGELWLLKDEVQHLPATMRLADPKNQSSRERPLHALRRQKIWAVQIAPRVTLDRITAAPNLFQAARSIFSEGCGLWFGVVAENSIAPIIDDLLATLGENGLGGERTAGYGAFTFSKGGKLPDFPAYPAEKRVYLLSRYHPRSEEVALLQANSAAYRLDTVRGWLHTPAQAAVQRRKTLCMISEGSLLPSNPKGDAPDVRPEYDAKSGEKIGHLVYRPGFAITIDWKG